MGEVRNRAKIYPAAISAQVSAEIKEALAAEAEHQGVKESEIVRQWLDAGRRSAKRRAASA